MCIRTACQKTRSFFSRKASVPARSAEPGRNDFSVVPGFGSSSGSDGLVGFGGRVGGRVGLGGWVAFGASVASGGFFGVLEALAGGWVGSGVLEGRGVLLAPDFVAVCPGVGVFFDF